MFDKLIEFVTQAAEYRAQVVREREAERKDQDLSIPRPFGSFWAQRRAGDLVDPCLGKARHHRGREKVYVGKLEVAEKELRDKGISMEVFDNTTGGYVQFQNSIASGALCGTQQSFQPRIDQKMSDAVKHAKAKMLEHRSKAEGYEKLARAFQVNPAFTVRLNVEDVTYFGLGSVEYPE